MRNKEKDYLNDENVTKVLLIDIENDKMSDELANMFMLIQKNVLSKPNFNGYYGQTKDEMISRGNILLMKHWKSFKPYRVKNNYSFFENGKIIKDVMHKSKIIYIDKNVNEYDLIQINNRTYTVKSCKKEYNYYKINLYNKLKSEIKKNTEINIFKPKFKIIKKDGKIIFKDVKSGGFSFLSLFVFTAAKNAITSEKQIKEKDNFLVEMSNKDIDKIVR